MSLAALVIASMMSFQDDTGTAVAKPIGEVLLEPETGSYFQIFEFIGRPPYTWEHASLMVRGYHYQEREGMLATVKTVGVHYFLLLNFPEINKRNMWIGLQVECNEQADIRWIDGTDLADQSFRAWDVNTLRNISRTCRENKLSGMHLPVYYGANELGVRWEVGSEKTNLSYMMVEFPVPKEEHTDKADKDEPETHTP